MTSAGNHEHCDKCYSARCRVPVQISASCAVVKCGNNCGVALHACKQEEHRLLCANQEVACLNAHYGCPLTMPRRGLAQHLEVCPASVVCCSQEWTRWPVAETDLTFYRNLSEERQTERHLDAALARRDQELLFRSIKMKDIFPELTMEDPALRGAMSGVTFRTEGAACALRCGEDTENGCARMEKGQLGEEERAQSYNTWEKVFTKEMGGCKETVQNLKEKEEIGKGTAEQESSNSHLNQETAGASPITDGATGFAPWQDGVLERLGREVNISEYNMYLVHNGAMLINFDQLAACTPRERDFVYGKLEPIEVMTVRSFNVPTSYRAKRAHVKGPSHKAKTAHKSVDTADLGVSVEDLAKCDEVAATLLCSLEKELKGHVISESAGTDGLYVHVGTQTYDFRSAPFKADATLADVAAGRPRGLYVHVQAESVTRRHNRANSAFSYVCGHFFRRNEYRSHFRNVHSDIGASLCGWLQQRCPLAYLGCTFTQTRLQPAGHPASIEFCQDVSTLVLRPQVPPSPCEGGNTLSPRRNGARRPDPLSGLPLEILRHVAGYLDSFTLAQLSQVSRQMRELCATLLPERGMVSLRWEKKTYSHGGSSWRCREKVWQFSSVFSSVDRWSFSSGPSMSDHLKTCSFYQREARTEPVALACLGEARGKHGDARQKR